MGHPHGPVSRLTARTLALAAALLLAGGAQAAEIVFRDITWPRHSKKTGFLESELSAATARPISSDEYACSQLETNSYTLAEKDGRKFSQKEFTLRADEGTYKNGLTQSNAVLKGHVGALLYGPDPLHIATDQATMVSKSDAATQLHERTIDTRSPISAQSATRTLTGEGMTLFDQVNEKDGKTLKSSLRVNRNVTMVIRGENAAGALPVMAGGAAKPPEPNAKPEPATLTCLGPLVYDRLASQAVFQDHATLTRADSTLKASRLIVTFENPDDKARTNLRLKHLLAEDDVVITGTGQTLAGTRFEWDPVLSAGSLTGAPATLRTPDTAAQADKIEFDQKTQKIKYVGNAEIAIELKAE